MKLYEDPPEEISYPAHPAHKLTLVRPTGGAGAPFVCDGCKVAGDGPRYTCGCGFDLHTCCALADDTLVAHPLLGDHRRFVFLDKPPSPVHRTVCDACGEPARGFVYHCHDEDLDLHPCCASLQPTITLGGHAFELCNGGRASSRRCALCVHHKQGLRRSRFWAYRSFCDDGRGHIYLHVACVKEVARRSWDEAYHGRAGHGGGVVEASVPVVEAVLMQSLPRNAPSGSAFDRFIKIVGTVAKFIKIVGTIAKFIKTSVPVVEAVLMQSLPRNAPSGSAFDRFIKIVGTVAKFIKIVGTVAKFIMTTIELASILNV